MRLESALNTGREGITAHGQAIAVVGDNISNANTTAYKTQRAIFSDILGEKQDDRTSEVVTGGGDGVAIRQVQTNYETAAAQGTGRELDVALDGNGFFMCGAVDKVQLTRSGSLALDENGMLVTSFGQPVLGYQGADIAALTPIDMKKVDVVITPTTEAKFFGNMNSSSITTVAPTNPATFQEVNGPAAFTNVASVYDSLGERHEILFAYYKTGVNKWSVHAYVNGTETGGAADVPVKIGETSLTFDTSGRLLQGTEAQSIMRANATWANGGGTSAIAFDFSSITQFAGASMVNNITQNGQGKGEIVGYQFTPAGGIFALLSNGAKAQVGSLAVARVTNEDGLIRSGTSTYEATTKAGVVEAGLAGTGGRGRVLGRSLESSNVDLAGQFVDLVVLQRGYSANSRVISTASEIIKDTISLIR